MKSLAALFAACCLAGAASAYSVSNLKATYSNGQVFLTWKCPEATNLKYNLYRSITPFTSASQINSANYVGNVRDSSSKNFRLSAVYGEDKFFRIDETNPLSASKGLYVVTCTDSQPYYYMVTVTDLSTAVESKKIKPGKNTILIPTAEAVADPQPVWQDSAIWNNGDVVHYYTWFGNNQHLDFFPEMCSQGSYGFNFYLIRRGEADYFPVFAFYEGLAANSLKGNGIDSFANITDCYILGFDDWIPTPSANGFGDNTLWTGYHEDYDMYIADNPIPTTGIVKLYSQNRFIHTLNWSVKYLPVDSTRMYLVGVSAGGLGAMLTACLIPDRIAAVYTVVGNFIIIAIDNPDTQPEQMWGDSVVNLKTNILDPETGDSIRTYDLFDMRKLVHIVRNQNLPPMNMVYGRNDMTIPWTPYTVAFSDSLQANRVGGTFFWDQREHDGDLKDFNDKETMTDWFSYSTRNAFPAFSNCSVNQNIGNGLPNSGDDYGAINGYLDFVADNIADNDCNVTVRLLVKDLYVGGVPDPIQYETCTADVTIRRTQKFNPQPGNIIKWNNFDSSNSKIQGGSFTYTGDLLTIPGVIINKSKCRLDVKISGCQKEEESGDRSTHAMNLYHSGSGWHLEIFSPEAEAASLVVVNILGEVILHQSLEFSPGQNEFTIPYPENGVYLVSVQSNGISESRKITLVR